MPVRVSVLAASGVRMAERADSNLVSVLDPDMHERPVLAGPSDGPRGHSVSAARQLFPLGGRLGTSAAADEHAPASEVAGTAGWDSPPPEPDSRGDLPPFPAALLLVHVSERVGYRHRVSQAGGLEAAVSAVRASRHDYIQ